MLLKLATIGFIGLLALPSFAPRDLSQSMQPVSNVDDTGQPYADGASAVAVLASVAYDISGLCSRNPQVCAKGAAVIDGALVRAEHGFRIAYAMVINHRDATQ
ncbi:MAG: DUF5330 domain-containing protein [Ahrensia sp.]